jgi:predicted nuclease with TOPRIM domain
MTQGILSPESVSQLALLRTLVDPDAKVHLAESISQVMEAQKQAEAALVGLREQEATNRELLDGANRKLAEAAEMAANAEALRRRLDAREKEMGEVAVALNDEKARFEEARQQVAAEQKARWAELAEWAQHLAADQAEASRLIAQHAESSMRADALAATYEAKHKRLHEAMMANEGE